MQEAEMGITSMAFSNGQQRTGDENLLVKFYMHPRKIQSESEAEGRPIFKDVPHINIMQPGNKDNIINRVATSQDISRFAEHYRKFEARVSQEPEGGTPLDEWPAVTRSQVEELRFYNVLSVEQLAGMSDSNAQNFRGINSLRTKAKAFLEFSKENAGAEALATATARNDQLEETIAKLSERLSALEDTEEEEES